MRVFGPDLSAPSIRVSQRGQRQVAAWITVCTISIHTIMPFKLMLLAQTVYANCLHQPIGTSKPADTVSCMLLTRQCIHIILLFLCL